MESWRRSPRTFGLFVVPPTLWLAVLFVAPGLIMLAVSLSETRGLTELALTFSTDSYRRALTATAPGHTLPLYVGIFLKSVWMAALTTVACVVLGLPVALGISAARPRARRPLLLLLLLPFWTNLLIRTYALIAVLRTTGLVNRVYEWVWWRTAALLGPLGLGRGVWLSTTFEPLDLLYTHSAVLIGLVYVHLPFMVLPIQATLERLDPQLIEASLDLGAGRLRTLWSVVLPLARPGVAAGSLLVFVPALGAYLTPTLLGGTDSQMIANVIESQFLRANDWPFGAALSMILIGGALVLLLLGARLDRRRQARRP